MDGTERPCTRLSMNGAGLPCPVVGVSSLSSLHPSLAMSDGFDAFLPSWGWRPAQVTPSGHLRIGRPCVRTDRAPGIPRTCRVRTEAMVLRDWGGGSPRVRSQRSRGAEPLPRLPYTGEGRTGANHNGHPGRRQGEGETLVPPRMAGKTPSIPWK